MKESRVVPSFALCMLLAGAASGRAWAIPIDPATTGAPDADERAARWLATGNKAYKEGNFAEAERAYREAFAIKKGFDIAGNLGMAEIAQGKLREGAQHLAFTLRMFPITGEPALREQMQKAYDQCREGVAGVRVKLAVRGATILMDGLPAGEAPLADEVFVEPGEHVVEAKLEGYTGAPQQVTVAKGASVEVTLPLTPLPPPPLPTVEVVPARRRNPTPGLALAAVAVAGLGGGAGFLGVSLGKRSEGKALAAKIVDVGNGCASGAGNFDPRCPALESTLHADDAWHDVAVGSFIVGGAAAVGAAAYFLWPRRASSERTLQVTPILGSGDGGVLVSGSF